MLRTTITAGQAVVPGSLSFCAPRNAVWATTAVGDVIAVRLFDRQLTTLGSGYVDPVAVTPIPDGLPMAIVESGGSVFIARRDSADRSHAKLLAEVPNGGLACCNHPDRGLLLVLAAASPDGTAAPLLLSCDLATGELVTVASGLEGATAIVADAAQRQAI